VFLQIVSFFCYLPLFQVSSHHRQSGPELMWHKSAISLPVKRPPFPTDPFPRKIFPLGTTPPPPYSLIGKMLHGSSHSTPVFFRRSPGRFDKGCLRERFRGLSLISALRRFFFFFVLLVALFFPYGFLSSCPHLALSNLLRRPLLFFLFLSFFPYLPGASHSPTAEPWVTLTGPPKLNFFFHLPSR